MPVIICEEINSGRQHIVPFDKVRAVHKVIGTLAISAEPGWQDDGTYFIKLGDLPWVERVKARTKKGTLRKEPRGSMRYDQEFGKRVRRVTIRLFKSVSQATGDVVRPAAKA